MSVLFTTQEPSVMHSALLRAKLYGTAQAQDFLATCKGELFGETETYFFKYVNVHTFKEVRLFKKSKRVTTSRKRTSCKK